MTETEMLVWLMQFKKVQQGYLQSLLDDAKHNSEYTELGRHHVLDRYRQLSDLCEFLHVYSDCCDSLEWKNIRTTVIATADGMCTDCLDLRATEVHVEAIGLLALCKGCHARRHPV